MVRVGRVGLEEFRLFYGGTRGQTLLVVLVGKMVLLRLLVEGEHGVV
jgi:hypothetical protein